MPSIKIAVVIALLSLVACGARADSNDFEPPTAEAAFPLPDCVSESPCSVAYRDENGNCAFDAIPGCTQCIMSDGAPGTARDGVCCGGCWAGSWCSEEPNEYACGAGGRLCAPCDGAEMCVAGACILGDY
jgi:hypothetical protein